MLPRTTQISSKAPNIVLFVPEFLGLGDLFFGLKTAQMLREKYPNAKIHMITEGKDIEKLKKLAPEMVEGINLLDEGKVTGNIASNNKDELNKMGLKVNKEGQLTADLFVEGPVFQYLLRGPSYYDPNVQVILAPAYNVIFIPDAIQKQYKNVEFVESGFGEAEFAKNEQRKGILIDHELRNFALANDTEKAALQQQALERLNNHLGPVLFGKNDPKKYLDKTEVSFAYNPDRKSHYTDTAHAVAASQKNSKKNIDFFVAGNIDNIKTRLNNPDMINRLKENGYTRVEFVSLDNPDQNETWAKPKISLGREKVFRVLYKPNFPHEDVKNLFKLSHIAGIAGNQSLSEAISCGVIPVCCVLPHDRPIFLKLTSFIRTNGGDLAADAFGNLADLTSSSKNEVQNFGESLSKPSTIGQFKQAFQRIYKDYDLGNTLVQKVEASLPKEKMIKLQGGTQRINPLSLFNKPKSLINEEQKKLALQYLRHNRFNLDIEAINKLPEGYQTAIAIKFTKNVYKVEIENIYKEMPSVEVEVPVEKLISFAERQKEINEKARPQVDRPK